MQTLNLRRCRLNLQSTGIIGLNCQVWIQFSSFKIKKWWEDPHFLFSFYRCPSHSGKQVLPIALSFSLAEQDVKARLPTALLRRGSNQSRLTPPPHSNSRESLSTYSLYLFFFLVNGRHSNRAELAHVFSPFGHHHLEEKERYQAKVTSQGSMSRGSTCICVHVCVQEWCENTCLLGTGQANVSVFKHFLLRLWVSFFFFFFWESVSM